MCKRGEKLKLSCTNTPVRGESLLNCTYFYTRTQHVRIFVITSAKKFRKKTDFKCTDIKNNFTLKKLK